MTVIEQVMNEVQRATTTFPTWPTDPLHALAVLGEEFGELTKAMLQLIYESHKTSLEAVREEAIQTAAMALRLAMSLDRYEYQRSEQHEQDGAPNAHGELRDIEPATAGEERGVLETSIIAIGSGQRKKTS